MPRLAAASTVRRTASAPERCPAKRGRCRAVAHRPFPSMMIATCILQYEVLFITKLIDKFFLPLAHGLNQGLHVIQISLQGAPAGRRQPVLGLRQPSFKRLSARNVVRVLQLAGVDAQVAVGGLEE